MAAGLAIRLVVFSAPGLPWDVGWYMTMAVSLLRDGEFFVPWEGPGVYTQHFPPLYPLLLAAGLKVFGTHLWVMHAVAFSVSVFLVATAFLTTVDLYGRRTGFAVAAVVAVFPFLVWFDIHGYTESLVTAFFTLTIWGILRSLDEPRYVVWAGVFAALGYLTKASMGSFFFLAGAAGFAWRFAYMRWDVLRDRHYLSAAAILGGTVAVWAGRNVLRHGWPNWQTQRHASEAFSHMFAQPEWPLVFLQKSGWIGVLLLAMAVPFLGEIRNSFPRWREEATSGLWMAIATPVFVSLFFVTAFHMFEATYPIIDIGNARYVVTPLVPLLWLGLRDFDLKDPMQPPEKIEAGLAGARRSRLLAVAGVSMVGSGLAFGTAIPEVPYQYVVYATTAIGSALVAFSAILRMKVTTRTVAHGSTTKTKWRYVPDPGGGRAAALSLALVAVGLAASKFVGLLIGPFAVAGGLMLAIKDPRGKVAAIATIFLCIAAGTNITFQPESDIANDIATAAPEGGTVVVHWYREHLIYPLLPESFTVTREATAPDFIVEYPTNSTPTPPPGYVLWKTYPTERVLLPGTLFGSWVEARIEGREISTQTKPRVLVFVPDSRDGTATT